MRAVETSMVGFPPMGGPAARIVSSDEIEGELRAFGAGDPRILAVYLFGSRGRQAAERVPDGVFLDEIHLTAGTEPKSASS